VVIADVDDSDDDDNVNSVICNITVTVFDRIDDDDDGCSKKKDKSSFLFVL